MYTEQNERGYLMKIEFEIFTIEEAQKIINKSYNTEEALMLKYAMEQIAFAAKHRKWGVNFDLRNALDGTSIGWTNDGINWVRKELKKLGYGLYFSDNRVPYKVSLTWAEEEIKKIKEFEQLIRGV